ncbi:hypothetical protein [Heyndrickxia ginsengihumi]|uniref:Co-chaperone DjlA N-terminal domain-containing protein n=1 Tax=Heyndrickxia ginsengihumi TaxID=363870 RepID=A0A0A6VC95_9BACI|nr:hypothetical protein [Heyndrickxia ginsengihumi]KHD85123.1 hypothetical protein NG54_11095 [Heyndrickxia ginsengihumi]MBE6185598.1 hypothetical protein [Bacillus sp. (in: firmicutes)]NEY20143.1 hypothetical protein [Heyndrickxia ginsengihumi]
MFLAELQLKEKEAFLELAALIAKSDGRLSIYEDVIFEKYQKEMGLENYTIKGLEISEIVKLFTNERSKTIALTEILRLIFSDGVFHDQERESINLVMTHFGFDPHEYGSLKDWVLKIKDLSVYQES